MNNTKVKAQLIKGKIDTNIQAFQDSFVIVPYVPSGYLDITNKGFTDGAQNVSDHETFKRVWTGNDAFTLNWKGSTTFNQDPETKEIKTEFKVGEVILGLIEGMTGDNQIKSDQSFSNYKSQEVKNNIRLKVDEKTFTLDENYSFYFYKIPELFGSQLFKIVSISREYLGNKLVAYVLDFETINQELANTGRAKQQNVMPNAPGQAWIECTVLAKDMFDKTGLVEGIDYYEFYDRIITADKSKLQNRPICGVNFKAHGVCGLSFVSFEGRRVKEGSPITEFGKPRLVFPMNLQPTTSPTLFNSQTTDVNYYAGWFFPSLENYKDMMTSIKDTVGVINEWSFQGWAEFNYAELQASNPLTEGDGVFSQQLYGSLETDAAGDTKTVPWSIAVGNRTFNTSMVPGCETTYNVKGKRVIHDMMFDAYWTQKKYITMPQNKKNTLGFGSMLSSSLAAFGKDELIAGTVLMIIGLGGSLIQHLVRPKFEGMFLIIPCSIIDLAKDQFKSSAGATLEKILLTGFNSTSNENPYNVFFSGNTLSTSFNAKLTDTFEDTERVLGSKLTTDNIGQKTYEDGTFILPTKGYYKLKGGTSLLEIPEDEGFIIDSFVIQAIFDGDYTIEFLDRYGSIVWTGIYQSEGKWTQSLREINTFRNTSIFGRENFFLGEPIPYPKPIPPPIGDITTQPPIVCDEIFYNVVANNYTKYKRNALVYLEAPNIYANQANWKGMIWVGRNQTYASLFHEYCTQKNKLHVFDYTEKINNWDTFKTVFPSMTIQVDSNISGNGSWAIGSNSHATTYNLDNFQIGVESKYTSINTFGVSAQADWDLGHTTVRLHTPFRCAHFVRGGVSMGGITYLFTEEIVDGVKKLFITQSLWYKDIPSTHPEYEGFKGNVVGNVENQFSPNGNDIVFSPNFKFQLTDRVKTKFNPKKIT